MPRIKKERGEQYSLRVLLTGTIAADAVQTDELARMLGCSKSTVIRRLKDPGTLTVRELLALAAGLQIPIEAIRQAISKT